MTNMTCFRFNMDNPEYARAWEHLHNVDKDRDKSANYAVVKAINEYFDRRAKLDDDPYFETRQREERFVEQIVSEVGKALTAEMPKFLASFMMNLNTSYAVNPPVQPIVDENDDFSAIDMDFIGG
ncbi:MAG TPA: hypothetical protein DCG30_07785 [Ruminococcus sp.]|nr:hypothetical protein [Ruminococcus sp.]